MGLSEKDGKMVCQRCGGSGAVWTESGYAECSCRRLDDLRAYLRPMLVCVEDREKALVELKKAKPLEDRSQAILRNDRNIVSLIKMMSVAWRPAKFQIVSVTDLNAIEFGRWGEYESVHDLLGECRHVIVDARFISKTRDSKMREYDEHILIETMRSAMATKDARVAIMLPATLKPVKDAYPGLLKAWNEIGEFCYTKGKIGKFPPDDIKDHEE